MNRPGSSKGAELPSPRAQAVSTATQLEAARTPSPAMSSSTSSSSSADEMENRKPGRPQPFRHPSRFKAGNRPTYSRQHLSEEDEDEVPAFLPFAKPAAPERQDLGSTIRDTAGKATDMPRDLDDVAASSRQQLGSSSASSAASAALPVADTDAGRAARPPAALSPHQRAQLTALSARKKKEEDSKTTSDGTPSMGSSFSDLDRG